MNRTPLGQTTRMLADVESLQDRLTHRARALAIGELADGPAPTSGPESLDRTIGALVDELTREWYR
jgi:hypothetical protein